MDKAVLADIDLQVQLRLDYLKEDYQEYDVEEMAEIERQLPDYFHRHLGKDLFCYVAREGEDIVSCALLLVVEKPMNPSFINGKTGTVFNVYTKPSFRRKGYAKKIMSDLIKDAEEMKLSVVDLKSTEMGYPLYASIGFKDVQSHYHEMKWTNKHLKRDTLILVLEKSANTIISEKDSI